MSQKWINYIGDACYRRLALVLPTPIYTYILLNMHEIVNIYKICSINVSIITNTGHIYMKINYVQSSWGIIHIDASARIYIYNYTPYLLFWPALLLGLACSWSVVLSPVIVLFLFLANDDFDLSSTTSSTAGPSSSSPVVLMMRHPSSLDAPLTLQPITSSN